MQTKHILFIFISFLGNITFSLAQNHIPKLGEIYKDDVVPRIDITVAQADLDFILEPQNAESDTYFPARFIFNNGSVLDTIENVGFRLRGNTSRYSAKKSFKVSFNKFESGRKYHGVEKLNINGEHNDPSIIRSKICWDLLRDIGIPAPRANHVEMYVNGAYKGLYINVEHIDEEFIDTRFGNNDGNLYKCLYPSTLEYLGENQDLYKGAGYELKINEEEDDFSDLVELTRILNTTAVQDLPCELEKVFNVDSYLKAIAFDILTGNWDGPIYNKNNFYLYKNEDTGQFEYIPFDLDNTFGIDWFGIDWAIRNIYNWAFTGEARPIYTKILAVPMYKDRFSFYMNEILTKYYNSTNLNPRIDALKEMIRPSAVLDNYRTLDYGFNIADFDNSYTASLGQHVKAGLKPFITVRTNAANGQLDINEIAPIVSNVRDNNPVVAQQVIVQAKVEDEMPPAEVKLFYRYNTEDYESIVILDDGSGEDETAGDGIYTGVFNGIPNSGTIDYYIIARDNLGQETKDPICETYHLNLTKNDIGLYINELMAGNDETISDEAGEFEDWIELYNGSDAPIFLGDKYLTDNFNDKNKWKMPDISIEAGEFVLFWADNDDGVQNEYHTNFKLSKSGEEVGIFDEDGNLLDGVTFGELDDDLSYARDADGTGDFVVTSEPTPNRSNQSTPIIELKNKTIEFEIYPNPTTNGVQIQANHLGGSVFNIQLHTMLGKLMLEQSSRTNTYLDFPDGVANGIYFLTIEVEGKTIVQKIVKE